MPRQKPSPKCSNFFVSSASCHLSTTISIPSSHHYLRTLAVIDILILCANSLCHYTKGKICNCFLLRNRAETPKWSSYWLTWVPHTIRANLTVSEFVTCRDRGQGFHQDSGTLGGNTRFLSWEEEHFIAPKWLIIIVLRIVMYLMISWELSHTDLYTNVLLWKWKKYLIKVIWLLSTPSLTIIMTQEIFSSTNVPRTWIISSFVLSLILVLIPILYTWCYSSSSIPSSHSLPIEMGTCNAEMS